MSPLSSKKAREEDPKNYRPVNPTSDSGKITGKILLENHYQIENTKVFQNRNMRFTRTIISNQLKDFQ